MWMYFFFFNDTATTEIYTLSLHDALPILEQCYSFDPVCNLQGEAAERVLGLQGNLWTEQVPTMSHCEYMLYPRLFAIAENGWSQNKGAFSDFHRRALNMQDVLRAREIGRAHV